MVQRVKTSPPRSRRRPRDHVRVNRRHWDRLSASYDRRYRRVLSGRFARAWGVWRIPERDLGLLGPVRGKSVLELGCGAARWSIALSRLGARCVGLDQSGGQLRHALRERARGGRAVSLVRANAEQTPFPNASFDLVFCDWGAMTFCDPYRTVPEVARLLRPGGRFVFATSTPIFVITDDRRHDRPTRKLRRSYFDLYRIEDSREVEFQLPYGVWIDLFRNNGFVIDRLIEPRPGPRTRSKYLTAAESRWSRQWPREAIWQLRKLPSGRSAG